MSRARRQYNPDEIRRIMALNEEGYTYQQIASKIRPGVKSAWRSVGNIVRSKRSKATPTTEGKSTTPQGVMNNITIRKQFKSKVELPESIADSLSAKEYMSMLDDNQRALWVSTYEDLRGEADDEQLTKAENEMLMRASYSHIKYIRAQNMLSLCETYLMMELDGQLGESPEDMTKKRLAGGSERYKKEAEQWHKEYMELLNDLKLTRKQRLDKIKDTRNTFLDLQQELMSKAKQDSIIEDIKRINLATEDELRRMAKGEVGPDGRRHTWLLGAFDEIISKEDLERTKQKEVENENGSISDSQSQE